MMADDILGDITVDRLQTEADFASAAKQWRQVGLDSGDARYLIVAEALSAIFKEFDEMGGIPVSIDERIRTTLEIGFNEVRSATDPRAGTAEATRLLEKIRKLLSEAWSP